MPLPIAVHGSRFGFYTYCNSSALMALILWHSSLLMNSLLTEKEVNNWLRQHATNLAFAANCGLTCDINTQKPGHFQPQIYLRRPQPCLRHHQTRVSCAVVLELEDMPTVEWVGGSPVDDIGRIAPVETSLPTACGWEKKRMKIRQGGSSIVTSMNLWSPHRLTKQ